MALVIVYHGIWDKTLFGNSTNDLCDFFKMFLSRIFLFFLMGGFMILQIVHHQFYITWKEH